MMVVNKVFILILSIWLLAGLKVSAKIRFDECFNCNSQDLTDFLEKTSTPYSPFSLIRDPAQPSKGKVLLLHGLTDSPYYLKDVAKSLYLEGYDVYVPLLAGHGNDQKTLSNVNYEQWLSETRSVIHELTLDGSSLILGGFSNGGLLSTVLAKDIEIQKKIKMMLLFAPALEISTSVISKMILSILRGAKKWLSQTSPAFLKNYYDKIRSLSLYSNWCPECTGYVKNKILPLNGPLQVYSNIRDNIKANTSIMIPTVLVISGSDSVIDSKKVTNNFSKYFKSDFNHIFWITSKDDKIQTPDMPASKLTILESATAVSHSGLIFETNERGRRFETNPEFQNLQFKINETMNSISSKLLCSSYYK